MGVTIVIGEAVPATRGRGEVRVVAAFVEQPDAPDIAGDRAGRTNTRRPTWSAWRGFARSVGLAELLLDPLDGLTRGPSGCVRLLPGHVEEIEAALARYRAERPEAVPGWREPVDGGDLDLGPWRPETEGRDPDLARLVWLAWWARWAVERCALPVVAHG